MLHFQKSPSWIKDGRQTNCCIEYTAQTAWSTEVKFGVKLKLTRELKIITKFI